jgi:hypothetical protein
MSSEVSLLWGHEIYRASNLLKLIIMPLKKPVIDPNNNPIGRQICKHELTEMNNGFDVCKKCKEALNQDFYARNP